MQATAALETDSDKNYPKNGGHFQNGKDAHLLMEGAFCKQRFPSGWLF
jgi:hypothetical protein